MANLLGHAGLLDGGDGVAAAHDGERAGFTHCACHPDRPLREGLAFKDAHGPVPHDGLGVQQHRAKRFHRALADVESHFVVGDGVALGQNRLRIRADLIGHDVVQRQQNLYVAALGFGEQLAGQLHLVVFHQRAAHRHAFSLEKSVGHAAADQ